MNLGNLNILSLGQVDPFTILIYVLPFLIPLVFTSFTLCWFKRDFRWDFTELSCTILMLAFLSFDCLLLGYRFPTNSYTTMHKLTRAYTKRPHLHYCIILTRKWERLSLIYFCSFVLYVNNGAWAAFCNRLTHDADSTCSAPVWLKWFWIWNKCIK